MKILLVVCFLTILYHTGDCQCPQNCTNCTPDGNCSSCPPGYYGQTCQHDCSVGCENETCDITDGSCACKEGFTANNCSQCVEGKYGENCDTSQCISGYYGPQCQTRCPVNCYKSCQGDTGNCISCKSGFFHSKCQIPCPENCDGHCDKDTGDCYKCKDGFDGSQCDRYVCMRNCATCDDSISCLSCKDGFYGVHCSNACKNNCLRCTSQTYCRVCKDGYFGSTCALKCPKNCISCSSRNLCTKCQDGFTGSTCSNLCSSTCAACLINHASDACTSCSRGRYAMGYDTVNGDVYFSCRQECSSYCVNGFCENDSGKCTEGCVAGYTGDRCDCPDNCVDDYCSSVGECSNGSCDGNFIGITCSCIHGPCTDFPCTSCNIKTLYVSGEQCCKCPTTCRDNVCSDAETCLNGCVDGFHGNGCQQRCQDLNIWCLTCADGRCNECLPGYFPSNGVCTKCSTDCLNNICSTTNGTCLEGCANGFWGSYCNIQCSTICKTCDMFDGRCTVCNNNKYKRDCSKDCNAACKKSAAGATCDIDSGACTVGCLNHTMYGDTCQLDCNTTCAGQVCDWRTGKCTEGCVVGYHGAWCQRQCSENCNDNPGSISCVVSDGTCYRGCKNGYYRHDCQAQCASICINETCERATGYCTYGCMEGFTGVACGQEVLNQSESGNTGVVMAAVVCVLVFLLLAATVVAIVFYLLRRKRRTQAAALLKNDPGQNVAMAEINNGNANDVGSGVPDSDTRVVGIDGEDRPVVNEPENNTADSINEELDVGGNDTDSNESSYDQPDQDMPRPEESPYETLDRVTSIRTYDQLAPDNVNDDTDNTSYYNVSETM